MRQRLEAPRAKVETAPVTGTTDLPAAEPPAEGRL